MVGCLTFFKVSMLHTCTCTLYMYMYIYIHVYVHIHVCTYIECTCVSYHLCFSRSLVICCVDQFHVTTEQESESDCVSDGESGDEGRGGGVERGDGGREKGGSGGGRRNHSHDDDDADGNEERLSGVENDL